MGVTIHYEGQLKDLNALDQLLIKAQSFAQDQHWPFELVNDSHVKLNRYIANEDPDLDGEDRVYEGPVVGIKLNPHPECEPFTLEFDSELFCQDWTKTQFAGSSIHQKLIELLSELQPLFAVLKVLDESDYWSNRDQAALEESLRRVDEAIEELLREHPNGRYKVREPNGRLIDLIK